MDKIHADNGRYRVTLAEKAECMGIGDYGADFSTMSSSTLHKFKDAGSDTEFRTFNTPLNVCTADSSVGKNPSMTVSSAVTVSITLILPGSQLHVYIHGVEFYVVDTEMDEELLWRPFLQAIGFELTSHLKAVGETVREKDVEELKSAHLKISKAEYEGTSYLNCSVPPPANRATGFGEVDIEIDKA